MNSAAEHFDSQAHAAQSPSGAPKENDLLDSMPWLPCTVTVDLPVVRFTIGELLALKEGSIVETSCHQTSDLPLRVNNLLIGWSEFHVTGEHLAVRITQQA